MCLPPNKPPMINRQGRPMCLPPNKQPKHLSTCILPNFKSHMPNGHKAAYLCKKTNMSATLQEEMQGLRAEIARYLSIDLSLLTFELSQEGEKHVLRLVTTNLRHQQSFLYHTVDGFGELDTLHKMLGYIKAKRPEKSTYTIQWSLREEKELHTSYFRGKDLYEVLDKFYYGKDINATLIFSVSLNPIA